MDWIKSSTWEIKRSIALQGLGVGLCLSHLGSFLIWMKSSSVLFKPSPDPLICWAFFPRCADLQLLTHSQMNAFISSMCLVAGLGALSFLSRRGLGLAWALLLSSFVGFSYVITFDPQVITNNLIAVWFFTAAFLFFPKRQLTFILLFCAFFAIEAILKINVDWLAGFWLADRVRDGFSDKGIEWLALAVLVTQVMAPVGFLVNTKIPFLIASIMLLGLGLWWGKMGDWSLLAAGGTGVLFFFLRRLESKSTDRDSMYQSYMRPEPSQIWAYVFLGFFLIPQLWYRVTSNGKSPAHPFALGNYDIPQECNLIGLEKFENGHRVFTHRTSVSKNQCDLNYVERFLADKCSRLHQEKGFIDISVQFYSRKVSQSEMKRRFTDLDFCKDRKGAPRS